MTHLIESAIGSVGLLRLNRPERRNALSLALRADLAAAVERLSGDRNIRCLVITGNATAFASGGDLHEMQARSTHDVVFDGAYNGAQALWRALESCPKPIVAAVNGFALGGGCELMLHADLVVAGENAKLGQPEVRVGIMPGAGGVQRFVRAAGKVAASRWLLTGDLMSAADALALGLVAEVVEDSRVVERALELAEQISKLAPLAVQAIKECIALGPDASLPTALAFERKAFQLLYTSEDRSEGISAFIEKRPPQFKGR